MVWYTGQFYALFFLQSILKVDGYTANLLIAWSLLLGTGFFVFFGWLSDKIGRKPIILAGCAIAAVTYFPLFQGNHRDGEPGAGAAIENVKVTVTADPDELRHAVQSGRHARRSRRPATSPATSCRSRR